MAMGEGDDREEREPRRRESMPLAWSGGGLTCRRWCLSGRRGEREGGIEREVAPGGWEPGMASGSKPSRVERVGESELSELSWSPLPKACMQTGSHVKKQPIKASR